MGFIHCCSALRRSQSFDVEPISSKFLACQLDILQCCPVCNNFVVQLTRVDFDHNISIVRKVNKKAVNFYLNLKPFIISPHKKYINNNGKFYLHYNEFGKIKKCYSSLSSLKIGLHDNFQDLTYFKKII